MNLESLQKLENIIESRFIAMHLRTGSSGDLASAKRTRMLWHAHVCSLGMHLTGRRENDGRLYIVDPATMMESSWGARDGVDFIVVPEEMALKMLALGDLP